MSGERWLPVPGYEGLYEVSDQGRVRSVKRQIILRPYRNPDSPILHLRAYWRVSLFDRDHKRKQRTIHSLVAETFLGPCPLGQEVRHGSAGSLDNSVANLSYGTRAQNLADRRRDGTVPLGERHPNAKLTADAVAAIRAAHGTTGATALAEQYGVSVRTIYDIWEEKTWR